MQKIDMAHALGMFAKWSIVVVIFGFSITLSYTFFASIAPPDKPWFVYTALGLTEGGFILWIAVFMLARHHPIHKSVALVMSCACGISSLTIAGYEFYTLLEEHFSIASVTWLIQGVSIMLEIIFAAHLTALAVDLFTSYFSVPGHNFRITENGRVTKIEELDNRGPVTGKLKVIPAQISKMSFVDAAAYVLDQHANGVPMHYKEITEKALNLGLLSTKGKSPDVTMNSLIGGEINSKAVQSRFVRALPGMFALAKWNNP